MCNTWSESFTGGAHRGKIVEERITAVGDRSIETINERKNIKEKWTQGQGPVKQCQTAQHLTSQKGKGLGAEKSIWRKSGQELLNFFEKWLTNPRSSRVIKMMKTLYHSWTAEY